MGFKEPHKTGNYTRNFALKEFSAAPIDWAKMVVRIMQDVYGVTQNADLKTELVIQENVTSMDI